MSRDYGRIYVGFWNSPDVRSGDDDTRLLQAYLLTSPHTNCIGAFLLPDSYIADDLGWSTERVRATLSKLYAKGFAKRFQDGRHIVVCNFLKWNPIENPNFATFALKCCEALPFDDPAFEYVFKGLEIYRKRFGNRWETVSERYGKQYRNRESEREREPESESQSEREREFERETAPNGATRDGSQADSVNPKKPASKRKTKNTTPMPEDWPAESEIEGARDYWLEHGRADLAGRMQDQASQCRDYHVAKGSSFADWNAAWRTWVRNADQFTKRDNGRGGLSSFVEGVFYRAPSDDQ